MRKCSSKRRGISLLLFGAFLGVIVMMIALAVDAAYLYFIKARLSAACDAAALAAGRSLTAKMDAGTTTTVASSKARAFFTANFPDGYLYAKLTNVTKATGCLPTSASPCVIVDLTTTDKVRRISVRAEVDAPTWFLRYAGYDKVHVAAYGVASRRDVDLMLVLDRSGSMSYADASGHIPCAVMKDAAADFVNLFTDGRDKLGLVTYSYGATLDYGLSANFKSSSPTLESKINAISCVGGTSAAYALHLAYKQLVDLNEPGALNMIVFFTDGQPTALAAPYPLKTVADTRYGDGHSSVNEYTGITTDSSTTDTDTSYSNVTATGCTVPTSGTVEGVVYGDQDTYDVNDGPYSVTTGKLLSAPSGCYYLKNDKDAWGHVIYDRQYKVRHDFAYIPDTPYGAAVASGYYNLDTTSSKYFYQSGVYKGHMRTDTRGAIWKAAINATFNQGKRIRSDATLKPKIFTMGLGGADGTLLKAIANTSDSAYRDTTQVTGRYVYCADSSGMPAAFLQIAGEILRIAQ
jgi:Tfp pilus assembly protein PilV